MRGPFRRYCKIRGNLDVLYTVPTFSGLSSPSPGISRPVPSPSTPAPGRFWSACICLSRNRLYLDIFFGSLCMRVVGRRLVRYSVDVRCSPYCTNTVSLDTVLCGGVEKRRDVRRREAKRGVFFGWAVHPPEIAGQSGFGRLMKTDGGNPNNSDRRNGIIWPKCLAIFS